MEAGLAGQFTADGLAPSEVVVHPLGGSALRRPGLRAARGDPRRRRRRRRARGRVAALPRAAPRGVRAALPGEPDRDRQHPRQRRRADAPDRRPQDAARHIAGRRPGSRPAGACSASNGELEPLDTIFYRRDRLPVDEVIAGPAIVLQEDSTTLIPPGSSARADLAGNLLIAIGGSHE